MVEETPLGTTERPGRPVFNLDDPTVATVYANTTHMVIGQADVSILFGFQQIEGTDHPASSVVRIILTHDSFVRMMEYWAARYNLLQNVYGGNPKALHNLDQSRVNAAFAEMLGATAEQSDGKADNETTDDGYTSS